VIEVQLTKLNEHIHSIRSDCVATSQKKYMRGRLFNLLNKSRKYYNKAQKLLLQSKNLGDPSFMTPFSLPLATPLYQCSIVSLTEENMNNLHCIFTQTNCYVYYVNVLLEIPKIHVCSTRPTESGFRRGGLALGDRRLTYTYHQKPLIQLQYPLPTC